MITMNQMEAGQPVSPQHYYGTVRMIFGIALIIMGVFMLLALFASDREMTHLLMVAVVSACWLAIGAGLLKHQRWADWGFIIISGMTILGAGETLLRPGVLMRSSPWYQPMALVIGLFFAWGLWTLTRPAARNK
jgi:hypothetical protein